MAKARRRYRDPADAEREAQGYRLATAEITYWMPDHPSLLQSFIWQHYDLAPEYPVLHRFLEHWRENIEATLHSVRVASVAPRPSSRVRSAQEIYQLQ